MSLLPDGLTNISRRSAASTGKRKTRPSTPKDGAPSASLYFLNNFSSVFLAAAAMSKSSPFLRPGRRPLREWKRAKRDSSTAQADAFAGANAEEKMSACSARNDICCSLVLPMARVEAGKRDSSTAQADAFAGANAEEKASACSARNDNLLFFRSSYGTVET